MNIGEYCQFTLKYQHQNYLKIINNTFPRIGRKGQIPGLNCGIDCDPCELFGLRGACVHFAHDKLIGLDRLARELRRLRR